MKAYKLSKPFSFEEYLQLEKETGEKHEFHNGEVFAMAGGTINHGRLCRNATNSIWGAIKKNVSDCEVFNSENKILIEEKNKYLYPDTSVVCGEIEVDKGKNAITNPILIVEVLSKSTANYDRGKKFYFYRHLESLKEYVLIEQDEPIVEVFLKVGQSDTWRITRFEGFETNVILESIGIEISMKELYETITFNESPNN